MSARVITAQEAAQMLAEMAAGRIFTVIFVKRTTGELRTMNCRMGVTSHLAGGDRAYDFGAKGLVPVWDMQAEGYRCFPIDGLREIRLDGQEYTVEQRKAV